MVSPCGDVESFINERLLTSADLPPLMGSKPRVVVPTYSWRSYQLHANLCELLHQELGTDILGGTGSSTLDCMLLVAGLWDIIVDYRRLDESSGATLKPYDVGGMLVFLRGIGEWVLGSDGREVTGYGTFNTPICFLAARSRELAEAAFHALAPIIPVPSAAD